MSVVSCILRDVGKMILEEENYMYYAKSDPKQSIREHSDKLLKNLEILKNKYGSKIIKVVDIEENRFWELMRIICLYHDAGKVFSGFQNMIRKKLKEPLIETKFSNELLKHEQISPAFIPNKLYEMTEDERTLVYQAIYYHHERDISNVDREILKKVIEEDIKPNLEMIKFELGIEIGELKTFYLRLVEGQARITEGHRLYNDYCMMKGLLHRLDHSSSAELDIEDDTEEEVQIFVKKFLRERRKSDLNDLQALCEDRQDESLVVIGCTGVGKTDGGLIWSGADKTFFTLPLRISINAIFDRIRECKEIGYKHVGLLHSSAFDYLENKSDIQNEMDKIDEARNLYNKITACTVDQIFPFVFKYRGYEKMYATLSYSKVIIDEIQAYSPEMVAIILKGLEMIYKINGKFMVMTATLPSIYTDKLEEMGIKYEYGEYTKKMDRHKIKLLDTGILEDIDEMCEMAKEKKVLVIVNTVNKALEMYKVLENIGANNVNVLHSRFLQEDRVEKERMIKEFSETEGESGIWITTQIVEASLDIDFDVLYTEMSTLDSLFQRMGRCYRKREYTGDDANIRIYTENLSGLTAIYDKDIHEISLKLLKGEGEDKGFDNEFLSEGVKIELVKKLYSRERIEKTKFYEKFKESFKFLDNIVDYDSSKKEAQRMFRNIDNIDVIPRSVFDDNSKLIDEYKKEKNVEKKAELKRKIENLFISIPAANIRRLGDQLQKFEAVKAIKGKYIVDCKYDKNVGLLIKKDEGYEIELREF